MNNLKNKMAAYDAPQKVQSLGMYPYFRTIESEQDTVVKINGKDVLMFGSNSYLGLTNHPKLKEAAKKAIDKYGSGCAGSRFLNGTLDLHLTLEDKLKNHGDWSHIKKVKIQADEAEKMSSKYRRSFGQVEREERFAYKKEARELRKWARELEYKLTREIVGNAKVVVSTLIGAAHPDIDDLYFDTVIIDEASQALEPESWVAMIKGKRTILAGDHKQLPPTVKSRNAAQLGLETTLLDILTPVIHDSYLLNTQYRMNDTILGFSNQMFYNGKLLSSEKVANRLLRSLPPLTLIDTSGTGFEEVIGQENRSYKNDGEFFLMREHILANKENLLGASIGVISPYAEQIRNLRISFEEETDFRNIDFEIDTIDGFQGQEKDVIYISLVRSNDKGV